MDEVNLIRGLKQGSKSAFDAIYAMYFKRLFVYCLRFTKSSEDAEEIVQDVFLRLWNIRESIQQEDTLRSLLFIISKNYLINAFHKNINSPVYEDYVNYQEQIAVDDISRMEYEEFVHQLNHAMSRLPKTQQQVIELSRFKQLSNKEVAERLSLSEQTVKNQLSLGLKMLRSLLGNAPIIGLFFILNDLFRYVDK